MAKAKTKRYPQPLPNHLKKYVVKQNYKRYTPENQATWRYIMRQLRDFLSVHAHESYVDGLKKTGISVDSIPRIDVINKKLRHFGWGAVPVSGFIPPAAFMEFQSLGYLPIASDMRTIEHLTYTPAPDIVHEAAGHAPILVDPKFASYLKHYAEIAKKAIISSEDLALYEAIRELSDIKESPMATRDQITAAEKKLDDTVNRMSFVSEASLLGRMNWWTAEYGLIGSPNHPKIFGAGLLSSMGESRECLSANVKKIPLTLDCINYSYDITEPQPQLFVTPDFDTLVQVLDELADQMAFRRGGLFGLERALQARTVNTVQLDSGLQIGGQLKEILTFEKNGKNEPYYLKFKGPTQLCVNDKQLSGHGRQRHAAGFGIPLGLFTGGPVQKGHEVHLRFASGVELIGTVKALRFHEGQLLLATFKDCTVSRQGEILFDPAWGEFDLGIGLRVTSVFGGPADRRSFGDTEDFTAARVPKRKLSKHEQLANRFYLTIRSTRNRRLTTKTAAKVLPNLWKKYKSEFSDNWLMGLEIVELMNNYKLAPKVVAEAKEHLNLLARQKPLVHQQIQDGLRLLDQH